MLRSTLFASLGFFLGLGLNCQVLAQTTAVEPVTDEPNGLVESLQPEKPFRIVGFGDSLMAGYLLEADQSFTTVLEKRLNEKGYNIVVDNAGVSGDTTTGGLQRLDWSIPDDTGLVIVELGANDMLRGLSPEITEKNLDAMLARLKERKIPVILAGMLSAPNMGGERAKPFNAIYPQLAKKYQVPLYPFFLDGVSGNSHYVLDDGMHPNAEGVEIMVDKFLPVMEKTLTSLKIQPVKPTDNGEDNSDSKGGSLNDDNNIPIPQDDGTMPEDED